MARILDDKRKAALDLYLAGYTLTHIADILGIARNTVSKWQTEDDWKDRKIRMNLLENNSINELMEIFEFQVRMLKERKDRMEAGTEDKKAFAPGEFDALQKLYSTIKPDMNRFRLYVTVMKELFEYIQAEDHALAITLQPIADKFLAIKQRAIS